MKRKCTKAVVERVGKLTNWVFSEAMREAIGLPKDCNQDVLEDAVVTMKIKWLDELRDPDKKDQAVAEKQHVDSLYLVHMSRLTTKQLEEIMLVHEAKEITRTKRTIETILSELTRRALLNDSNESDNTSDNGEKDEPSKKSGRRSKKATPKRSNSSAGRRRR